MTQHEYLDLPFFSNGTFNKIVSYIIEDIEQGKKILPKDADILRAFELTPIDKIKVVIVGQDPYPNKEHPIGLAFAVRQGTTPLPKSLLNIFRELEDDIGVKRTDGDLSDWAKQGVLLLNTSLTVVAGIPGSHSRIGWQGLVRDTIDDINKNLQHVVFVLWGRHAQQFEMYIDQNIHHIIKASHPSPLSAHRGFFGSKPFSSINSLLLKYNKEPITW